LGIPSSLLFIVKTYEPTQYIKTLENLLVDLILISIAIFSLIIPTLDSNKLLIAVITPLTGEQAKVGSDIVLSINLFAERINKYEGIGGKRILFKYYDSQSSAETTRIVAKKVVSNNKVLAVIAGFNDATAKAAVEIFEPAKIPMISPLSHFTIDSEVLFQISPTFKGSGLYIAYYIKEVLNKTSVSIIHSKESAELALIKSFEQTFRSLGGVLKKTY
jgi:branched-chain amino acid transport system substrate-binding protein